MDCELISKKELLEMTGISYGQLYRWKRKQLIPEDWFIRKSAFTGQETYFPKKQILARIDRIKNMKEGLSLDDIADALSTNPSEVALSVGEILEQNIVSETSLDVYTRHQGAPEVFSFPKLLGLYILEQILRTGKISLDEGGIVLQSFEDNYGKFEGRACELIFVRKLGVSTCLLVSGKCEAYFDSSTLVVARLDIAQYIEELKAKLS